MTLAYMILATGEVVTLDRLPDGRFAWRCESQKLADYANSVADPAEASESSGNVAAWALGRLRRYLPSRQSCVVAGSVSPADRNYGAA